METKKEESIMVPTTKELKMSSNEDVFGHIATYLKKSLTYDHNKEDWVKDMKAMVNELMTDRGLEVDQFVENLFIALGGADD